MTQQSNPTWVVIKFGGTSVSNLANWQNIVRIINRHQVDYDRILVVCSAPSQVSNKLDQLISQALIGNHGQILTELKTIYQQLSQALSLNFNDHVQAEFTRLQQLAEGIALLQEASPRIKAQVMSFGELALTRLGVAYLSSQGIPVAWQDARELLLATPKTSLHHSQNIASAYLAAQCIAEFDQTIIDCLNQKQSKVLITQGFIARNKENETVLLGRGGSDVSAAYLAAKISAHACEIWTDVPGVYSANPHQIPEARLLKNLDYDEAQEIASMGGKVLHPNCISPMKLQQIPLYVKYTLEPEREGTKISLSSDTTHIQIKSIINKYGVLLITIETMRMWRQAGFLARIFDCFRQHNISIDLVSTSESSVTVSLDLKADALDPSQIEALLTDLNTFAEATKIGPCAAISLIGHNIRAILPKLGQVFNVFEQQKVHLLSQAANDLNLTFVVDEDQAQRITQRLHALLIEDHLVSHYFGRSWQQEFGQYIEPDTLPWWQIERERLLQLASEQNNALYVYSQACLDQAVTELQACTAIDRIFYSVKANGYLPILQRLFTHGLGFECVSLMEVEFILNLFQGIAKNRILFTPNFAPRAEYERALELNVLLTIDSLYPLQYWPELFANRELLLRIDPGQGYGHHKYVCTGGTDSKFGIPLTELDTLTKLVAELNISVIGLHAHAGSGILRAQTWQENSRVLTDLLERFKDVVSIDLGGGLGIVEKPGQKALDLALFNESLLHVKEAFPQLQLWLEPGRYLVAAAGVLLAKTTQIKTKNKTTFVGLETGMNSLIRPALYGSYHEIVNLTRLHEPNRLTAHVVGPICESGDTLGYSRLLPETVEGDVFLIANAGAYGHCMSSHYNMREPATEYYLVNHEVTKLAQYVS